MRLLLIYSCSLCIIIATNIIIFLTYSIVFRLEMRYYSRFLLDQLTPSIPHCKSFLITKAPMNLEREHIDLGMAVDPPGVKSRK